MLTYDVSSLGSSHFDREVLRSAHFSEVADKLRVFRFPMRDGVHLIPVQLIPEFTEEESYCPIAIHWNGELLGHLSEDTAREYQQILRLSASRCVATSFVKASQDLDRLTVSLRSPALLLPLNNPPRDPYALLPATTSLPLTHNEGLEHVLLDYLPPNDVGLLLVTLHNVEVLNEGNRQAIEVRLDGHRVGELASSETRNFRDTISQYAGLGMLTAATAQISGSESYPQLRITTTRAKKLDASLLNPSSDYPLPTLVPFEEYPQDYQIPEDFDALELLSDTVVRIPTAQGTAVLPQPPAQPSPPTNAASLPDNHEVAPQEEDPQAQAPDPFQPTQVLPEATQLEQPQPPQEDSKQALEAPLFFDLSSMAEKHVVLMEPAPQGTSEETEEFPLAHYQPPASGAGSNFEPVDTPLNTPGSAPEEHQNQDDTVSHHQDTSSQRGHGLALTGLIVGSVIMLLGVWHGLTTKSLLFVVGAFFIALAAFAPGLWWFSCEYIQRPRETSQQRKPQPRYWPVIAVGAVASALAGIFITWEATVAADRDDADKEPLEPTSTPTITSTQPSSSPSSTESASPIAATEISLTEKSSSTPEDSESEETSETREENQHSAPEPGEEDSTEPRSPRENQYTYITLYPEEEPPEPELPSEDDLIHYEIIEIDPPAQQAPSLSPAEPSSLPTAMASVPAASAAVVPTAQPSQAKSQNEAPQSATARSEY